MKPLGGGMNTIPGEDLGERPREMLDSGELTVSVIVPVSNGGANFRRCLQSLAEACPPPAEIIVVADGDTDGSWRLAEEFGAQVIRLPSPSGGPALPRNLGARGAQGELLYFIDADVTIPSDAISQVVGAFKREPDLAALFGSYDDAPAATNFLSQYKNLLHHYVHQTAREEASTFWGACGAIRREVFLAVGGFDERYNRPSIEDIELGYRLRKMGHRIRLCKALQVKHLKRWDVSSLLKADLLYRALPWTNLILRDRQLINDLNVRLSSRISILLTYGLIGTVVAAMWWPGSLAIAGLLIALMLVINASLYRFFYQKRGFWFAVQTIPWHWLYFFYCGLALVLGIVRYPFQKGRSPRTGLPVATDK